MGKSQKRLPLENNGRIFLIWPTTICHFINSKSPFYELSPKDLLEKNFEIILSMTGISEKTGLTSQVYLKITLSNFKQFNKEFFSFLVSNFLLIKRNIVGTQISQYHKF